MLGEGVESRRRSGPGGQAGGWSVGMTRFAPLADRDRLAVPVTAGGGDGRVRFDVGGLLAVLEAQLHSARHGHEHPALLR